MTVADDLVDERAAEALARGVPFVMDAWLGEVSARALRLEVIGLVDAGLLAPAGIGGGAERTLATDVRRDSVCWFRPRGAERGGVQPGAQVALFLARLDVFVQHLNGTCFLGLQRVECHAACFEPGAFYAAHKDTFNDDARRVISYCYYLNDAWDEAAGGCLRMHGTPHVDVAPLLDRLVVFRSNELVHQVLPTTVRRLSLTGWLSRAPVH